MLDLQGQMAGAPIVAALVEVFIRSLPFPRRAAPLLALVLGLAWNLALRSAAATDATWAATAVLGIMSGLSASGLYSAGKNAMGR